MTDGFAFMSRIDFLDEENNNQNFNNLGKKIVGKMCLFLKIMC